MSEGRTNWGKVAAIVGSVVGVVAIAVCAAASLLLGWCDSMLGGPESHAARQSEALAARLEVEAILGDLERGEIDAARERGTAVFRASWPPARLSRLAERLQGMGARTFSPWNDIQPVGDPELVSATGRIEYEYLVRYEQGNVLVRFDLVRQDDGSWKVDLLEAPDD